MAKRIYKVGPKTATATHLVRASTKSVAIAHVAREQLDAEVAKQEDLVKMLGNGMKVEEAGEDKGD